MTGVARPSLDLRAPLRSRVRRIAWAGLALIGLALAAILLALEVSAQTTPFPNPADDRRAVIALKSGDSAETCEGMPMVAYLKLEAGDQQSGKATIKWAFVGGQRAQPGTDFVAKSGEWVVDLDNHEEQWLRVETPTKPNPDTSQPFRDFKLQYWFVGATKNTQQEWSHPKLYHNQTSAGHERSSQRLDINNCVNAIEVTPTITRDGQTELGFSRFGQTEIEVWEGEEVKFDLSLVNSNGGRYGLLEFKTVAKDANNTDYVPVNYEEGIVVKTDQVADDDLTYRLPKSFTIKTKADSDSSEADELFEVHITVKKDGRGGDTEGFHLPDRSIYEHNDNGKLRGWIDLGQKPYIVPIRIKNRETSPVRFSTVRYEANELGQVAFDIEVVGTGAGTVDYEVVDVTTTAGSDYSTQVSTDAESGPTRGLTGTLKLDGAEIAGTRKITVYVATLSDTLVEGPETFELRLHNATGTLKFDAGAQEVRATGLIHDNSDRINVDAQNVTVTEGGIAEIQFKLSRKLDAGERVSFSVTADGDDARQCIPFPSNARSVRAGQDYELVRRTPYIFEASDLASGTDGTIRLYTYDDEFYEDNECFMVQLDTRWGLKWNFPRAGQGQGPDGIWLQVPVTIVSDDQAPQISFGQARVVESDEGTAILRFPVRLGKISDRVARVSYNLPSSLGPYTVEPPRVDLAVGSGPSADYQHTNGQLTFEPGETEQFLDITVNGDYDEEPDEYVWIEFSGPQNACLWADGTCAGGHLNVPGIIVNDDQNVTITLKLEDDVLVEGESTRAVARLSRPIDRDVYIQLQPQDGTATNPSDPNQHDYRIQGAYEIVIAKGATEGKGRLIEALADSYDEGAQHFTLKVLQRYLRVPGTARTLAKSAEYLPYFGDGGFETFDDSLGTHLDVYIIDGPALTLTAPTTPADNTLAEGQTYDFVVTLDPPALTDVTFNWQTIDGAVGVDRPHTARAGEDYVGQALQEVTIPAGETQAVLRVTTLADDRDEPRQQFRVQLSSPSGAVIDDGTAVVTIRDDDPPPTITINDASAPEGRRMRFTVSLSHPSDDEISVEWMTEDGTAKAYLEDYTPVLQRRTLLFKPGWTARKIDLWAIDDAVSEPDETFKVQIANVKGAIYGAPNTRYGTATIQNDDGVAISVGDATVSEPVSGTATATFTITAYPVPTSPITLRWGTRDGFGDPVDVAVAGEDYVAQHGQTVTFGAGETSKTITVQVKADHWSESDERFRVAITQAGTGARLVKAVGIGTITANGAQWSFNVGSTDINLTDGIYDEQNNATTAVINVTSPSNDQNIDNEKYLLRACIITPDSVAALNQRLPGWDWSQYRSSPNVLDRVGISRSTTPACNEEAAESQLLEFPSGSAIAQLYVSVKGGTNISGNHTVHILLEHLPLSAEAYPHLSPEARRGQIVSFTVMDKNSPHIVWRKPSYTASESGGYVDVTFGMETGRTNNKPVTVDVAVHSGTAILGRDFGLPEHSRYTLQGGHSDRERTVRIPLVKDGQLELDETFTVTISTGSTDFGVDPRKQTTTVTITDGDQTEVFLPDMAVDEGSQATLGYYLYPGLIDPDTPSGPTLKVALEEYGVSEQVASYDANHYVLFPVFGDPFSFVSVGHLPDNSRESPNRYSFLTNNDDKLGLDKIVVVNTQPPTANPLRLPPFDGYSVNPDGHKHVVIIRNDDYGWVRFSATWPDTTIPAGNPFDMKPTNVETGHPNQHVTYSISSDKSGVYVDRDTAQIWLDPHDPFSKDDAPKTYTVTLTVTDEYGNSNSASGSVRLTFTPRSLDISETALKLSEPSGSATFTVGLDTHEIHNDVTVTLTADGDNPAYTIEPSELTFTPETWSASNKESQTVTITVVDDPTDNKDDKREGKIVITASGGGFYDGDTYEVAVTVDDDDDAPAVSIADAEPVNEGNDPNARTNMRFPITLAAASEKPITVTYTLGGDATAGEDYVDPNPKSFDIPAGSDTAEIVIAVKGDTVKEGNEKVEVTLSGGTNVQVSAVLGQDTATGTIIDEETTQLVLSPKSLSMPEHGGEEQTYTVKLNGQPGNDVTVELVWLGSGEDAQEHLELGTGTGSAFTAIPNNTLTFTTTNWNTPQTITVRAVDNSIDDPGNQRVIKIDHRFSASLGGDSVSGGELPVTLVDEEVALYLVSPPTVVEGETASFQFYFLDGGVTEGAPGRMGLRIDTADITATAGEDYTAVTETIALIREGEGTKASPVAAMDVFTLNDNLDEEDETFSFTFSADDFVLVAAPSAVVTITDNDSQPTVEFSAKSFRASEGNPKEIDNGDGTKSFDTTGNILKLRVQLSKVSGRDVTVEYTTSEYQTEHALQVATPGEDYTAVTTPQTVTIPAGKLAADIPIQLTADFISEGGTQFFNVDLANPVGATLGDRKTARADIAEDDEKDFKFSKRDLGSIDEAGGRASYSIKLKSQPTGDVTVALKANRKNTIEFGTVIDGEFTPFDSNELIFTPENWNKPQWVKVQAVDNQIDLKQPTVTIAHGAHGGGYGSVQDFIDVKINDNDITMKLVTAAVAAEGDAITFEFQLKDGQRQYDGGKRVELVWVTADDSTDGAQQATADVDYPALVNQSLKLERIKVGTTGFNYKWEVTPPDGTHGEFKEGSRKLILKVPTTEDLLNEDDETFALSFDFTSNNVDLRDQDNNHVVDTIIGTITDDDDTPTLTIDDVTVEEGETAEFTVTLSAAAGRDVSFEYTTGDDTTTGAKQATTDVDYTAVSTAQTLTIAAGDTTAKISVPTADDGAIEDDETFVVTLASPINATLGTGSVGTGTITDNDQLAVKVEPATLTVSEVDDVDTSDTDETVDQYTVRLNSEPTGSVTVALAVTGDDPNSADFIELGSVGNDGTFNPLAGFTLTFTPENWSDPQTVALRAVDNLVDDPGNKRTVTVTHTASGGGYDTADAGALTVEILDNDFTAHLVDASTVAEGGKIVLQIYFTDDGVDTGWLGDLTGLTYLTEDDSTDGAHSATADAGLHGRRQEGRGAQAGCRQAHAEYKRARRCAQRRPNRDRGANHAGRPRRARRDIPRAARSGQPRRRHGHGVHDHHHRRRRPAVAHHRRRDSHGGRRGRVPRHALRGVGARRIGRVDNGRRRNGRRKAGRGGHRLHGRRHSPDVDHRRGRHNRHNLGANDRRRSGRAGRDIRGDPGLADRCNSGHAVKRHRHNHGRR